jgi:hypothetical protein
LVVTPQPVEQAGKLPTIGFLGAAPSIESQRVAAFEQRLRELGWLEGRTVAIEYRWAEGRNDRYAENAAELARSQPGAAEQKNSQEQRRSPSIQTPQ